MPFPEVERVIYRKNPLKLVVCQVRFPTILKISEAAPAEFQERLRDKFPIFEESLDGATLQLPESLLQIVPREIMDSLSATSNVRYQFMTNDRIWTISLTRDFVALETSRYTCWEEFRENIEIILRALVDSYAPAFLIRIGLRYQNIIDRRVLDLEDFAWKDLLADFVLGQLAQFETQNYEVIEQNGRSLLKLNDEQELVRMDYGMVVDRSADTSNVLYLLDNDFYTNAETSVEVNRVIDKLNHFNIYNRKLFRRCITDRLHEAMEPGRL